MKKILYILTVSLLIGCVPKDSSIDVSFKKNNGVSPSSIHSSVSSVQIINNQLVINGNGFDDIVNVKVEGTAFSENFSIESKSATKITANSVRAFSFDVSKLFNLIISDANASATFQIDFSLCNATLNGKGFDCAAPISDKDVLSYDAVSGTWKPRAVSGLNYLGAFNASSNPATGPAIQPAGAYYIISHDGMIATIPFTTGDWLVSNGSAWQKIDNSTAVLSVFGRSGAVTAQTGDYSLAMLSGISFPTAPVAGKVLKFDGTNWVAGDDLSGGGAGSVSSTEVADGTIVNADINAAAAIDYSKLNIPNTTIPYAKLNIADGEIPAAKISGLPSTSDFVSKSANSTVLGELTVSGTGTIIVPTPTILTHAANMGYVQTYVDAYAQWTKNGAHAYRTSGNVGVGVAAPAYKLEVGGTSSIADRTLGINGTPVLFLPDQNPSLHEYSIALGDGLRSAVGSASSNTAIGISALNSLTTGSANTATGARALRNLTSGNNNTANGSYSLNYNTSGSSNTGYGFQSLFSNTTGSNNTALGFYTLAVATGSNNTAIGYNVGGATLATGSGNILIGTSADVDTPAAATSNFLNIGNVIYATGMTGTLASPAGNVGIGTQPSTFKLDVKGATRTQTMTVAQTSPSIEVKDTAFTNAQNGRTGFMYFTDSAGTQSSYVGDGLGTSNALMLATTISEPITFLTNSLERMIVSSWGYVGIGVSSPDAKLHVQDGGALIKGTGATLIVKNGFGSQNGLSTESVASFDNEGFSGSAINIFSATDKSASIYFGNTSLPKQGTVRYFVSATPANQYMSLMVNSADRVRITSSGNVGIGTTTVDEKLVVDNGTTIGKYTTGGWTHSSDARLKHDISPIEDALDKILKIKGVEYKFNSDPENKNQLGFIAQEVEPIFPEVVRTDKKGFKSMIYSNLIAPLVESVKILYGRIVGVEKHNQMQDRQIASKADKAEIVTLRAENEKLKKENSEIRKYLCSKDSNGSICK